MRGSIGEPHRVKYTVFVFDNPKLTIYIVRVIDIALC